MESGQSSKASALWTQASALTARVGRPARFGYYAWRAKLAVETPRAVDERRRYELGRYGMDSAGDKSEFDQWLASWYKAPTAPTGVVDASIRGDNHFRRGEEWHRVNHIPEARAEYTSVIDAQQDNVSGLYAALSALFQRSAPLFAIRDGSRSPGAARLECERGAGAALLADTPLHHVHYADLVVAESQAQRIDPLLEFATIRLESKFETRGSLDRSASAGWRSLPSGRRVRPRRRWVCRISSLSISTVPRSISR